MEVEFADEDLSRFLVDDSRDGELPPGVAKAFRKRVIDIRSAKDEGDLYAIRSWRFEKLKGQRAHQRSIRLNDQWRLTLEIIAGAPQKVVRIIGIEDYHK